MELLQKNGRRAPSLTCCLCVLLLQLQAAWTGDCPADGRTWVPFKDKCYHFVHGEEDKLKVYNFESAKSLCPHSELLSIQSAEENDFVVKYSPEVWKGEVNVWLGMYYDTNSEGMMWFDEEPVKFTNWEPGSSPLDFVPMETCVAVHSDTGKWERVSCLDDLENGVVCETAQKADQAKKIHNGPALQHFCFSSNVTEPNNPDGPASVVNKPRGSWNELNSEK
ncbi:CD302 antigen isoform X2 [Hippocampus zosterae]|uniref:CD302 antigen isoform X2 n=1 Tax=Hippocampus zosterae TaxID=109293 RepID=UPI00223E3FE4|nr:CD302 antigen isoform X2 [Hippocampus zosterae]